MFKFVRQSKAPVNAVLAGYFSKVLTSLLSRKQNQLIPYLFETNNDAIDCLLNHIYQKSISEVLISILKIEEANFTDELASTIKKRKKSVIVTLVNKLGSETDDEECLNAATILNELIDANDYIFNENRQPTIERLSQIAFDTNAHIAYSRQAAKLVLEKLVLKINNKSNLNNDDDEDEDDKIKIQDSDDNED